MKRWVMTLTVLGALMWMPAAVSAEAPVRRLLRERPPSRYGVVVTYYNHGVPVRTRYTYPGYVNGFPPPAFLNYGYPQSGSTWGIGF